MAPGTFGSALGVLLFLVAAWVAGQVGIGPMIAPMFEPISGSMAGRMDVGVATAGAGSEPGLVAGIVVGASYLGTVMLILLLGIWSSGTSEQAFGRKDDGRIVIDEVVGQLIALTPLLFWSGPVGTSHSFSFFFWVVTGFVLFRLFDIAKPGMVRWAERRFEGGLGVMMDDVLAGAYAAITLVLLHLLLHQSHLAPGTAGIEGMGGIDGPGWG